MNPLQKEIDSLNIFFKEKETVLVGCSGGADSKSLVGAFLDSPLNLHIVVGHIDHGIRPESNRDAEEVTSWSKSLGLLCLVNKLHLLKTDENTARVVRHQALEKMREFVIAEKVALAHNANDQLETLLMRVCRGHGLTGACGIRKVSKSVIRPLLNTPRERIDEYIKYRGWEPIEDSSNKTETYFRNRVRKQVIPFFLKENPNILEVACNTAETLQEELSLVESYEQREWKKTYHSNALNLSLLKDMPKEMAARLLIRLWKTHSHTSEQLSRKHVVQALEVIRSKLGGQTIQLPGLNLKKTKYWLCVLENKNPQYL